MGIAKMMNAKLWVRGSLTVEACYVVIMTAAVVILCLWHCMLWHDKTVMEMAAWRSVFSGMRWAVENQNPENGSIDWDLFQYKGLLWRFTGSGAEVRELKRQAAASIEDKLLVCKSPVFDFTLSWRETKAEYRAAGTLTGLPDWFPVISSAAGQTSILGTEAEEWVRMSRGILFRGD